MTHSTVHRLSRKGSRAAPSKNGALQTLARDLVASGAPIYDLSRGELGAAPPEHVLRFAIDAVRCPRHKYTDTIGVRELRDALAKLTNDTTGFNYGLSNIAVTAGAKQALFNLMQAIVDEGDEVIIPAPFWTTFPEQVRLAGGTPVFVDTSATSYGLDPSAIARVITAQTRAIIINSPHNPTGVVYDSGVLQAVVDLARSYGAYVVFDECYADLVHDAGSSHRLANVCRDYERVAVVNSFSKCWSVAGWRIGYLCAPEPIIDCAAAIQSHTTSNPSCIAQYAVLHALDAGLSCSISSTTEHLKAMASLVYKAFSDSKIVRCVKPAGGFYAYLRFPTMRGALHRGHALRGIDDVCRAALEAHGVLSVPGTAFGDPYGIRLSYAAEESVVRAGIDRFSLFVSELEVTS